MASSLLGLAPGGGYLTICITANAGGLLHHLFTLTPRKREAVCFCGPCPAGSLLTEASRPGNYPTPCSMECGLSSMTTTHHRDRPTNLRHGHHTRKAEERQRQGVQICRLKILLPQRTQSYLRKSPRSLWAPWLRTCEMWRFVKKRNMTGNFENGAIFTGKRY